MSTHLTGDETVILSRLMSFGTARVIRERAGITATDFATRIGVATRTLRSWEKGHATPRQPYVARKYLIELRRASQTIVKRVEENRRAEENRSNRVGR
ncbi:helix-turn-helix domain-containing protein [Streptomyces solisilvae]|uniref:helix-turn-helix domain-containing protein n=1 Tax=Streptomyces malaysiensis TaxID=92644 RepID=UPI0036A3C3CC